MTAPAILALDLATRIKALRLAKRWSLSELARRAGCSKGYLWEIEGSRAGNRQRRPSAEKFCGIADALDVTIEYLLGADVPESDATDTAFIRRYLAADPGIKRKLRKTLDIWT